jgi:hypothetical protein
MNECQNGLHCLGCIRANAQLQRDRNSGAVRSSFGGSLRAPVEQKETRFLIISDTTKKYGELFTSKFNTDSGRPSRRNLRHFEMRSFFVSTTGKKPNICSFLFLFPLWRSQCICNINLESICGAMSMAKTSAYSARDLPRNNLRSTSRFSLRDRNPFFRYRTLNCCHYCRNPNRSTKRQLK